MNKIGMSLPWDYLSENYITKESTVVKDVLGTPEKGLKLLKSFGVTSIELRHLNPGLKTEAMRRALLRLQESEINISIHSEDPPDSDNWVVTDLFPWRELLEEPGIISQTDITLALHPVTGKGKSSVEKLGSETLRVLSELATIQKDWRPAYHFALENQRVKGLVDPGTTFDSIQTLWSQVDSPAIGICWDFGHGYANHLKNNYPEMPSDKFINAVTHTHIHDLGPSGSTHWPFIENKVPLEKFIGKLKNRNYQGIYNLELGFGRFADIPNRLKAVEKSVSRIKGLIE